MELQTASDFRAFVTGLTESLTELGEKESGAWTLKLKNWIEESSPEPKELVEAIYTQRKEGKQEFLLDLVLWDRRQSHAQRLLLAVESEWYWGGRGLSIPGYAEKVAEDFWKLMVVKAPYKLMIMSSADVRDHARDDGTTMRQTVVAKLNACLAEYGDHYANEHYILLDSAPGLQWNAYEWIYVDGASRGFEPIALPSSRPSPRTDLSA